jgi:MbtH protein
MNPPQSHQKEKTMSVEEREDTGAYKVVINHEDQYSIWPEGRQNPAGWRDGGKTGNKKECLAHIQEVWTDMRPRSLREKMDRVATSE